jgi:RNA polymerase sigma-70 factor (ECF subfamily)
LALWRDLRAGRASAPAAFLQAFLEPLLAWLAEKFPRADPEARANVVHDLLLTFVKRPDGYDPAKGGLAPYLRMAIKGDLLNLLAKKPDRVRLFSEIAVAEPADDRKESVEELPSFDDPRLQAALASFSAAELQVFELMRDGAHQTETFAAVLGITDRTVEQQQREVKRVKDRIMKRLRRAVEGDTE